MDAAAGMSPEKCDVFLQRVGAMLKQRGGRSLGTIDFYRFLVPGLYGKITCKVVVQDE